MDNLGTKVTLYEDWLARRGRLDKPMPLAPAGIEMQRRILDYLLKRYLGSPEAARPAHFPLRTNLLVDRRWIIVNNYLGQSAVTGIRTMDESTQRTSGILKRMASLKLQDSVKVPANGAELGTPVIAPMDAPAEIKEKPPLVPQVFITSGQRRALIELDDALQGGSKWRIYQKIEGALDTGCALSAPAVDFLCAKLDKKALDVAIAYEFLLLCDGAIAGERVLKAWIDAWAASKKLLADRLAPLVASQKFKTPNAEKMRELLGESSAIRVEAIRLLGKTGSIDDVSLLLDLYALPAASDDFPGERDALLQSAGALAGLTQADMKVSIVSGSQP